jgi:hypothetical protein
MKYKTIRKLYYAGILILSIYALKSIPLIKQYIVPVLEFEPVAGIPLIGIISVLMIGAGLDSYFNRTIG